MKKLIVLAAFLHAFSSNLSALDIPAFAELSSRPLTITDKALARRGLTHYQDDVTAYQAIESMTLDEKAMHEARVWGLTELEEKRYLTLMRNRSAVYYKGLHLTPIDILGLNARSEQERAHFAAMSAELEAQKVAQNLAWNSAFAKAYNELFKHDSVVSDTFDPTPYSPMAHKPVPLTAGDALFLFVKPTDACKSIVMTLSEAVLQNPGTRLHLMVLEADNGEIQDLAHRVGLSYDAVKSGLITLNHGELHYESLTLADKQTPLLVLARLGVSRIVDLGRI
ncbi:bile acid beta-glucosidase [Legionella beliardensis]|uniref:Bile acid beta-glucosidase n=1 Tax=Legionella beliardensis TaxID=91822 RepID=A0A378JQQ5_9GAMM|nr:TIGR03759 family integrating conjugative element protein [Legionella beliardensis]STX55457.1 bile acid beta-glucosidase [Legionella beliardensis]STX55529.1 bile acid beta-glucosidase [Legionella beliardensis]